MTTYNIASNLMNTTSRNLWIVARNTTSSAPAPTWFVWATVIVIVAVIAVSVVVLYDICKDDIEYFFWDLKHRKK